MADFSITGEVRLNSDPAEKSTSKWTIAAGQMIADFAKQASSKLAEVVKSGVDYNATMESYLTNFKVMLGSEEAAATKLSEIRKMAASTPFSLDDLTSGTQTLLQFGIAADDTTGVLQRLGDISLGNAEKLQTLTLAYGKMSSAQKVTLENVNMMIDAGFNPLNQICDATGESMSALYKRISDGKVSFNELEAAVAAATSEGGQFYNGMLEASQTFNGRLSTLKDNVAALTGELTSGLFSALGDIIVKANELVVSITEDDAKMAALKETIGVLTAAVVAVTAAVLSYKATVAATTTITALCTAATTAKAAADKAAGAGAKGLAVAQAALNAVLSANPIGLVVAALAALAAGLVTAYHTSETFRNIVNGAFQAVANIAQSTIGAAIGWLDKLSYKLNSFLVFLFSSKDFNDATRRIAYMRRYNRMREQKAARIDSTAASLGREVTDLQNKKSELDKVYQSRNRELASLGKDETQYKASSEKFRNEASRLASTIKQNKKKIEQLQQRIQRLIEAESRKHKAQPRSAAQNEYIAKLSGQFDQNRGKLPYPVRGVIVDGYGKHAHAVRQSVTVNNTGINIAAEAGAPVKAVFEGEVSVVFFVPGMNNAVMIRHGDYVTVYANLEAVGVKTGDRVALNQTIGKLPADDAFLHFEIWKDQQNLNPELWLRK